MAIATLAIGSVANAQALNDPFYLRGVRKVWIFVTVDGDANDAGFDASTLQTHIELALRDRGFKVSYDTTAKDGGLRIALRIARLKTIEGAVLEGVVASIDVEFQEPAYLRRKQQVVNATTWGWTGLSIGSRDHIERELDVTIERFLNDWYAANQ